MQCKKVYVDACNSADHVYAYTKKREPRVVATKGYGGMRYPLIKNSTWTKTNRATLIHLGVDAGKQEISNRLRVSRPGAGYCHFPQGKNRQPINGYDEEYFKGLRAEQRIVRHKMGFRTFEWFKRPSQRNEPFDCRVLALAALVLFLGNRNLDELPRVEYVPPDPGHSSPFGSQQMKMPDNFDRVRIRRLRAHDEYAYGHWRAIKLPGSASGFGAINWPLD
jgi:phage terminase large subunit GpA-like protein